MLAEITRIAREADLLHSEATVTSAVERLAARIGSLIETRNPLVLCVMNGGLLFTGWLLARWRFPLQLDYVHATRYRGNTSGDDLRWLARPTLAVRGRVVLLVDDIFDEGITLTQVAEDCARQGAAEVYRAVLVQKQRAPAPQAKLPDFIGLEVEDRYVFGCGMDYKHYLRNLPAIYAVSKEHL
jgi:hypoxanthine phosphoribosyltransferase